MTEWDGKFVLQLLSQCGSKNNCLSRSVPEIHSHVAGTLSNQQTNLIWLTWSSLVSLGRWTLRTSTPTSGAYRCICCTYLVHAGSLPICEKPHVNSHTEIEIADQPFYLTQSQYTDTGPTSPSADPITPGAWQGSHWSANFEVTGMTRPRKIPAQEGFEPGIFRSRGRRLKHLANEAAPRENDLRLSSYRAKRAVTLQRRMTNKIQQEWLCCQCVTRALQWKVNNWKKSVPFGQM